MSTAEMPPPAAGTPPPSTTPPPLSATPPPSNQPFHADWVKANGELNHASFERLPEDIRYVKDTLTKYKTPEEMIRGIAHLQTMGGKKGLIPLPADAPKEVMAERKALLDGINGVPKEAKDYGISRPADLPESAWSEPAAKNLMDWAHKNSVSPAAAKELMMNHAGIIKEQMAAQQQYETEFFANHQKAFDAQIRSENIPADRANALAERGATALGIDPSKPENAILLKNSSVRLAMMRHALATGEDTFARTGNGDGAPADPMAAAQDITHNKANPLYTPLHDSSHPQHGVAKAKIDELWKQAAAKNAARK